MAELLRSRTPVPEFIIVVRHGRFAGNVRAGNRGAAIDPLSADATAAESLDTYGVQQIEMVREFLGRQGYLDAVRNFVFSPVPNNPAEPTTYLHSPYARTTETAKLLVPDARVETIDRTRRA